jgi:hypothetical protein
MSTFQRSTVCTAIIDKDENGRPVSYRNPLYDQWDVDRFLCETRDEQPAEVK